MDANTRRRSYTIAMQMGDNDRAAIKPDDAEPPRHALTKKKLIAVVQGRFRKQFTRAVLDFPFEPLRVCPSYAQGAPNGWSIRK